MEFPDWSDIHTPHELAAALRVHGNRLAKLTGWYEIAQEILQAASCIEDLAEERDQLRAAGGDPYCGDTLREVWPKSYATNLGRPDEPPEVVTQREDNDE
jgi:hypothetical protein